MLISPTAIISVFKLNFDFDFVETLTNKEGIWYAILLNIISEALEPVFIDVFGKNV